MENEVKQTEVQETMDDYAKELEASFKKVAEGDMLTGTVIGVTDSEVVLDLKYYAEGKISKENLSNDPEINLKEAVQIGEEITATVIKTDDGEGNIVLSRKEANDILAWEKLQQMLDDRTVVTAKVSGIVNSGVIVSVEGIRGFIPASKLALGYVEDLNEWLGKTLDLLVITVDKSANKLVLSARELLQEKAAEERSRQIAKCEVGTIMEGTVDTIKEYGAFINLDNGLSGLLHVSQISDKRIKTPDAVLKKGDRVKVKITSLNNNKISLSMKAVRAGEQALEDAEVFDYKETGEAKTSLAGLLAGFKLDN